VKKEAKLSASETPGAEEGKGIALPYRRC